MAFILQKKKYYRFQVEVCVEELTAVPFINAVLFAKLRLLNGGGFTGTSSREEVRDHAVHWEAKFQFDCKMTANASTGILNPCTLRISVRREVKGGRSFQRLGFCNVNLAEFAGSGETSKRYLLEGYGTHQRQDNSMLRVSIKMNLLSGDILFKVPSMSTKQRPVSKQDDVEGGSGGGGDDDDCGRGTSFSSGSACPTSGSLSRKKPALVVYEQVSGVENAVKQADKQIETMTNSDNCESRVGSNTASGNTNSNSHKLSLNGHGHRRWHSSPKLSRHVRNASTGLYISDTSTLDETSSLERRKKNDYGIVRDSNSSSGIDADSLIDELIRSTMHDHPNESDENLGLQLFIAKDGTTTLGTPKARSQIPAGGLKEVVMKSNAS